MDFELTSTTPETLLISSYNLAKSELYTDFSLVYWFLGVELILLIILIFKRKR